MAQQQPNSLCVGTRVDNDWDRHCVLSSFLVQTHTVENIQFLVPTSSQKAQHIPFQLLKSLLFSFMCLSALGHFLQ